MGSGVALAIKCKYPKVYQSYKQYQKDYGLSIGQVDVVTICKDEFFIVNAITQQFYGRDFNTVYVSYPALGEVFKKLNTHFSKDRVFHFPKIGAGLANGDWNVISDIIEHACPGRGLVCWTL